jgi:hypothetical protein
MLFLGAKAYSQGPERYARGTPDDFDAISKTAK